MSGREMDEGITGIFIEFSVAKNGKLYWFSIADVFKAKRGERWVVRVVVRNSLTRSLEWEQYTAFTLREAMRLAKFIVGVKHGD